MISPSRRPVALAATLRARMDLRTGRLCGAVLRLPASLETSFEGLIDQLVLAKARWQRVGGCAPLHVALPFAQLTEAEHAAHLDAALASNGFSTAEIHLEIDESAFVLGSGVTAALEKLRGRGWNIGLLGGERPRRALDARMRNMFCTLVLPQACAAHTDTHAERIDAAKAAGWTIIAQGLPSGAGRAQLLASGFDAYEDRLGPST